MEPVLATASDVPLLGEISLSVAPTAPYVSSRNLATTYCATPSCSYQTCNVINLQIGSATQWMDPLTHQVTMNVINEEAGIPLQFASAHPMGLFERMAILLGGVVCEDVFGANRLANLLHVYESTDKRITNANLGFGTQMPTKVEASAATEDLYVADMHKAVEIAGGQSKRVCFSLNCSALLTQFKWVPLFAVSGRLSIRLTMANPADVVVQRKGGATGGAVNSGKYRLEDIRLQASLCTLDSQLQNKFFESLAAGEALLLHTQCWSHNQVYIAPAQDGSYNASINRPVSRLDTCIVSHAPEITADDQAKGLQYSTWFWGGDGACRESFQYQIQLGSSRFPDAPVQGFAQTLYRNLEALGIKNSGAHSLGTDFESFSKNKFAMMLDVSKVPGVKASGQSTQGGQEFRVQVSKLSNKEDGSAGVTTKRVYVALLYDCFYEIRAGSITKLD